MSLQIIDMIRLNKAFFKEGDGSERELIEALKDSFVLKAYLDEIRTTLVGEIHKGIDLGTTEVFGVGMNRGLCNAMEIIEKLLEEKAL